MLTDKLAEALAAEVSKLQAVLDAELQRGIRMLTHEGHSAHLGHNLGNVATTISGLRARLDQTTTILADLRNRQDLDAHLGGAR